MDVSRRMDSNEMGAYDPANFYRHALGRSGQKPEEAAKLASMWIGIAQSEASAETDFDKKLELFGMALHTVEDNTSPSHEGFKRFQEYGGSLTRRTAVLGDWIAHAAGETLQSFATDFRRVGMTLGAADLLTEFFFGKNEANRARGGAERGSADDPFVREFELVSSPELSEADRGYMLQQYRIGLAQGRRRTARLLQGQP